VGVLKFGGPEGAVPLHSLSVPLSDAAGPSIVSQLRFDQENTIGDYPMLRLMEALGHILDVARHEGGAGGIGAGTQVRFCSCWNCGVGGRMLFSFTELLVQALWSFCFVGVHLCLSLHVSWGPQCSLDDRTA
jgi:hypothetical protein